MRIGDIVQLEGDNWEIVRISGHEALVERVTCSRDMRVINVDKYRETDKKVYI